MEPLICRICKHDVNGKGFSCQKQLCPLDEFILIGEIEIEPGQPQAQSAKPGRYFIFPDNGLDLKKGRPAPSDSPLRYE